MSDWDTRDSEEAAPTVRELIDAGFLPVGPTPEDLAPPLASHIALRAFAWASVREVWQTREADQVPPLPAGSFWLDPPWPPAETPRAFGARPELGAPYGAPAETVAGVVAAFIDRYRAAFGDRAADLLTGEHAPVRTVRLKMPRKIKVVSNTHKNTDRSVGRRQGYNNCMAEVLRQLEAQGIKVI